MAKRNIKKIISVLAAVSVITSQLVFSAPMVSAVALNGVVDFEPENIQLGNVATADFNSIAKTVVLPSTLKNNFKICFDMRIDGRLGEWDAGGKNGKSNFLLTFNTGSRVSGFLKLGNFVAAPVETPAPAETTDPEATAVPEATPAPVEKGSYTLLWTDSGSTELAKGIEIGKTYSYEINFTNVAASDGSARAAVTVTDEDGNVIVDNKSGLSLRNFSDSSNNAVKNGDGFTQGVIELKAFDEGVETGVTFNNVRVIKQSPSNIKVMVDKAVVEDKEASSATPAPSDEPSTTVKKTEKTDIELTDKTETFYVPIEGTTYTLSTDTKYDVVYSLKEPVQGVSIEGNKIIVGLNAPYGQTEVTLLAALAGYEQTAGEAKITLNKEAATPQNIVDITYDGLSISDAAGNVVSENGKTLTAKDSLVLMQSNDYVSIDWDFKEKDGDSWVDSDVIDAATGKFTFKEGFNGKLKVTATITSKEDTAVSATKIFYVNISNPEEQLQLDLDELKKFMEDYEEVTSNIDLPKEGEYNSKITWTSSNPSVISTKGVVTRQSADKTVKLTATLENGGESVEEEFKIVVKKKKTSSSGGGGGSSSGTSKSTGGDSYKFYTPVTTTMINPIQSADLNATPNKTNQAQNLGVAEETKANTTFTDLGGVEWAAEAINKLAEKGIINGKSANEYAPNDNITRAEFAKILVNALNLTDPNATAAALSDVKEGEWYYSAVASAFTKGVIKGRDDGQFGVNDSISRQDMAVLLYRAAKAGNLTLPVLAEEVNFADSNEIDDYAKEAVTALQRAKIVNGVSETEFAPKATATRAVAAKMIYGIYNLQ